LGLNSLQLAVAVGRFTINGLKAIKLLPLEKPVPRFPREVKVASTKEKTEGVEVARFKVIKLKVSQF
jgi:hypothetical protein